MTVISAHQPAYLPWLGYLEKIIRSDVFVYLDCVQFEKNSYINRNKIKTPAGELWLTVPVNQKGHMSDTIQNLTISNMTPWRKKHWQSIIQNYSKAPFFPSYREILSSFYEREWVYLSDLCYQMMIFLLGELGVKTKIVKQSEIEVAGTKQELIMNLCKYFNADHFLFGALGKDYAEEQKFRSENISISFQDFYSPIYKQLHGDFVPNLAFLDALLNLGPQELKTLLSAGT